MSIKIASMNFGDCDTILHNTPNGMKSITEVLGPNGETYWTSTKELTGVPPLSIKSNGTLLLDYLISGNMSQSGTPTPDAPITPSECGERTRNLFDKDASAESGTVIMPNTVVYTDHKVGSSNGSYTACLPCKPNTTYRITKIKSARLRCGTTSDVPAKGVALDDYVAAVDGNATTVTINASENAKYIYFFYYNSSYDTLSESEIRASIQIEEGSSATSYEPYGYKLPINSRGINLFDKDNADIVDLYPDLSREIMQSSNLSTWSIVLPVEPSTTYTFTMGEATTAIRRRVGMCSDYPTKGAYCTSVDDTPEYDHPNLGNIFTTDADTRYVLIMYVSGAGRDVAIERANRVQVVKGNTALPYEPYGYKIPISVNGQTNNIYIGSEPLRKAVDGSDAADTLNYSTQQLIRRVDSSGNALAEPIAENAELPELPSNNGTTVIDAETALKPSKIYVKYNA